MSFKLNTSHTVLDYYTPLTGMPAQTGEFGIEIELEGDNLPHGGIACKGWEVHADNSLRGPQGRGAGGAEYTTRGAMPLEAVSELVGRLRDTLQKNGIALRDDSPRTSTHIHYNVQRMSFINVFGYLTVFAAIEPLFLHLCGPRRDGNSFCTTSFDSGDLVDWFYDVFRSFDKEAFKAGAHQEFPGRGKYASLGTFRLHDLGTLECRCFPYSIDPDTIVNWCRWMKNIRRVVEVQTDKSCRNVIKLGVHDPMVLIRDIFGELPISQYLAAELVQYGSREAYELTRLMKYFLNKLPDENKRAKNHKKVPEFPPVFDTLRGFAVANAINTRMR